MKEGCGELGLAMSHHLQIVPSATSPVCISAICFHQGEIVKVIIVFPAGSSLGNGIIIVFTKRIAI